ncbi:MAG: hypothetical protein R6U46_07540 [Marinilabilia sp.]
MDDLLIVSADEIFIVLIRRFLFNQDPRISTHVCHSFTDVKHLTNATEVNGVILDDNIVGFSSLELISFLRFEKKMICPVVYFSPEGRKNEEKALLRGATRYFRKPFNPTEVLPQLIRLFGKVEMEE